jgi:hypothetical protein
MNKGDKLKSRQHEHPAEVIAQLQCFKVVVHVASSCSHTKVLIVLSIHRRREVTGVPLSLTVTMLRLPSLSSCRELVRKDFDRCDTLLNRRYGHACMKFAFVVCVFAPQSIDLKSSRWRSQLNWKWLLRPVL